MTSPVVWESREVRVLMVIAGLGRGGAERLLVDLAGGLVRDHSWVVDVAVVGDSSDLEHELVDAGVTVHRLDITRWWKAPRGVIRYLRLVRSARPDVVHGWMMHANLLARLGRLVVPVPSVLSSVHNTVEQGDRRRGAWRLRLWTLAYRSTDRLTELTSHVTREAAADFVAQRRGTVHRVRFVQNGVDSRARRSTRSREEVRAELDLGLDETVLIAVGRLTVQKRSDLLVQAFAVAVERARCDARLLIVGDGPERPRVERVLEGVEPGRITLLGERSDVADLMAASDALVLSSAYEGMPLVVIEAMTHGLPVVATPVGGVPDLVGDDAGWLAAGTSVDDLATALGSAFAAERSEWAERGRAGVGRAERDLSARAYQDRWRALYEEFGARRPQRVAHL